MAKRSGGTAGGDDRSDVRRKSAADIVREAMRGYRAANSRVAAPAAAGPSDTPEAGRADARSESLEALRRKYQIVTPAAAADDLETALPAGDADDVEIITVV